MNRDPRPGWPKPAPKKIQGELAREYRRLAIISRPPVSTVNGETPALTLRHAKSMPFGKVHLWNPHQTINDLTVVPHAER
jgi:hypothetical protein